ncbi:MULTISPECIES: hypothetical protein [Paraburkholderia]|uniref:hypothetical protein n=1 Tax=Paraburkholderia TaxID=1822464 RepID=UPI0003A10500|nr:MULTISPECIES: hypothetical protein [Paraburkholderia]MDH6149001.1 hypothetical protein [Paraburkholderia sp. WSM4179]
MKLAFSSNGADGTLTIVHEDDADHYTVAQNMPTLEGAKTMALDEQQHRIYLVSSKFGAADPATAANPHPRSSARDGHPRHVRSARDAAQGTLTRGIDARPPVDRGGASDIGSPR